MEHKEHSKSEEKSVTAESHVCKEKCEKNLSCLKGHCVCMKRLAKILVFLMLLIITISVMSIAISMNNHHENYPRGGAHDFEQQRGMMYQIYR